MSVRRVAASLPRSLLCLMTVLAVSRPAAAQSRFEIGGGLSWTRGFGAGGTDARLSRGAAGATDLTLFETSSQVDSAPGVIARAGVFVTSRIAVEGVVEYSRPAFRVTFFNDFEQAAGEGATNTLASYVFGGSMLYHFGAGRLVPFAIGGAGRLRQLDEGAVNLVTGTEVHAGGGVKYRLTRHFGVRAEAMASSRERSMAFDRRRRTLPVVSGAVFCRF
jgi:hypothetical protein